MILIADSGATKAAWCLVDGATHTYLETPGINPYFLKAPQIQDLLQSSLVPQLNGAEICQVCYYGAGCGKPENVKMIERSLKKVFPQAVVNVATDLAAAAKALCGHAEGVACILGTGSNSCVFDGEKVIKNNPAPGFILGDEGSGAYLGKKVLQHYIYHTFDDDLMQQFQENYRTDYPHILDHVYKQPQPNRYLASFTTFLTANRGHFMIENIIEDGLNDFFFTHLYKYTETWTLPIHFTGSIAWYFKDVLEQLCHAMELQLGNVIKAPIEGLVAYHTEKA
jgi:glucosamine kinase